jgi:hypothetical protein
VLDGIKNAWTSRVLKNGHVMQGLFYFSSPQVDPLPPR